MHVMSMRIEPKVGVVVAVACFFACNVLLMEGVQGYSAQPVKYVAVPNLHMEAVGVEGADGAGISVFRGVREGLVGVWSACSPAMAVADLGGCYLQSEYSERLVINFAYDTLPPEKRAKAKLPSTTLESPVVSLAQTSTTHRITPSVLSFSHEPMHGSGSFVVGFDCERRRDDEQGAKSFEAEAAASSGSSESAMIQLEWKLPTYNLVKFRWLKVCGSGRHSRVEFHRAPDMGLLSSSRNGQAQTQVAAKIALINVKNSLRHDGDVGEQLVEAAEAAAARLLLETGKISAPVADRDVGVTELRVSLSVNGVLQSFDAPQAGVANHTVASVMAVGSSAHSERVLEGVTSDSRPQQFLNIQVSYVCHADGVTNVGLCISFPPFGVPTCVAWRKMCSVSQATRPRAPQQIEGESAFDRRGSLTDLRIASRQLPASSRSAVRAGVVHSKFVVREGSSSVEDAPLARLNCDANSHAHVEFVLLQENSDHDGSRDLSEFSTHPSAKAERVQAEDVLSMSSSLPPDLTSLITKDGSAFELSFLCASRRVSTVRVVLDVSAPSAHRVLSDEEANAALFATKSSLEFQFRVVLVDDRRQLIRTSAQVKSLSVLAWTVGAVAVLSAVWLTRFKIANNAAFAAARPKRAESAFV